MKVNILFVILFTLSMLLSAKEVSSINIRGKLEKTKNETIYNIIGYRVGDNISQTSEEEIKQNLIESGLFVEQSISVDFIEIENGLQIDLKLDEKFTTIPIPIIQAKQGEISAGIFILDSNFLGNGDQFFIGGIFSVDDQMVMSRFYHDYLWGTDLGIGGNIYFNNGLTEITDVNGNTLSSFDSLSFSGGLTFGWDKDKLSIHIGADAGYLEIDKVNLLDDSTITSSQHFDLSFNNLYFGEYFSRGLNIGIDGRSMLYEKCFDPGLTMSGNISWATELVPTLKLMVSADGIIYRGESIFSPVIRSSVLPGTIHANNYFKGVIALTPVIFNVKWAYIAMPVSFTAGYFDGISGSNELFWGPSTSLTFNFKKIAMPAVSFTYGVNGETMDYQIQANVGFQF